MLDSFQTVSSVRSPPIHMWSWLQLLKFHDWSSGQTKTLDVKWGLGLASPQCQNSATEALVSRALSLIPSFLLFLKIET